MDQLNRLLWLKCKINSRMTALGRSNGTVLGLTFSVIFLFGICPLVFGLVTMFSLMPTRHLNQTLNLLFTGIYLFWIFTPVLGHKLSGAGDYSSLGVFPVSSFIRIMFSFCSSCLDLPFLMFLPVLIVPLLFSAPTISAALWIVLITFLFLLHSVSMGQFSVVLVKLIFDGKSLITAGLRVVELLFILVLWGSQNIIHYYLIAGCLPATDDFSMVTMLFPSGIAAESVYLFVSGSVYKALLYGLLLLIISICSSVVTYILSQGLISGRFDNVQRGLSAFSWINCVKDRLYSKWLSVRGRSTPFATLVQKDILITARESQYKAIMGLYIFLVFAVIWILQYQSIEQASGHDLFPWMDELNLLILMFFATNILLSLLPNSIAYEKSGLLFALHSPVTVLEILLSKAMAHLIIAAIFSCFSISVLYLFLQMTPVLLFYALILGIGGACIFAGWSLNVAVLLPMPTTTGTPASARMIYLTLLMSLLVSIVVCLITPVISAVTLLAAVHNYWLWTLITPFLCLYITGTFGGGVFVASLLFRWRQDRLLAEVVE